jgi:FixJ family two-component response regulator
MNVFTKAIPRQVPIRVLIVDDEPVIVDELLEFFADQDIAAIAAHDAGAALRLFQAAAAGEITVILTDVKMPGQDGLSFAQSILGTIAERDAVEVIVMTGHGSFGMAIDALRSRVFDFLRKPVKLSDLTLSISRAHAAAISRRERAREDETNLERLRDMTLALSTRASALTQHVRDAPDLASPDLAASDVLRVICRELRNPLVPVVGLAELIEENAAVLKPAMLAEYAGLIRQAGWQLSNLVEAIESASSQEHGEPDATARTERASDIVAALLLGHGAEARLSGQTLEASPPPDAGVTANRVCLMLALDQLVSTAIRGGAPGQVVRIDTTVEGGELAFRIVDTGAGISPTRLAALRAVPDPDDISAARITAAGLALGLKLADRIALVLGGRLELSQGREGGTVAAIVLPLALAS